MKKLDKLINIKSHWLSGILVLLVAAGTSCKKLIEIPSSSPTQISQDDVFKDSADIMGAIAGIYANYKVAGGGQNLFSGIISEYIGCGAGELTYSYGNSFMTNTYLATDGTAASFWNGGYQNIYLINAALQGVAGTKVISDSLKQALLSELKVNRAFNYFYLVTLYSGVPIITGLDYKENANKARSSEDSVYDFIESDLKAAVQGLKPVYPSEGHARPNLYTAEALLARVALYRKNYKDAESMASTIIASGMYQLAPLGQIFKEGSSEAIWQLPAIGTYSQTSEGYSLNPSSNYSAPSWQVAPYLLDSFETGDKRLDSWVQNFPVTVSGTTTVYRTPWKYKNRNLTDTPAEGYVMLRLAEIYLIRAEARAYEGDLTGALSDLNQIRDRAGLARLSGLDKTAILKSIQHERQIEFCFEWGHRWLDLKRTGNISIVLGAIKSSWEKHAVLLPVPDMEMQNDPALTQNEGY